MSGCPDLPMAVAKAKKGKADVAGGPEGKCEHFPEPGVLKARKKLKYLVRWQQQRNKDGLQGRQSCLQAPISQPFVFYTLQALCYRIQQAEPCTRARHQGWLCVWAQLPHSCFPAL